jgi:hypothetical protein
MAVSENFYSRKAAVAPIEEGTISAFSGETEKNHENSSQDSQT